MPLAKKFPRITEGTGGVLVIYGDEIMDNSSFIPMSDIVSSDVDRSTGESKEKFQGEVMISFGPSGAGVVQGDGFAVAWSFCKADIARNHRLENGLVEVLPDVGGMQMVAAGLARGLTAPSPRSSARAWCSDRSTPPARSAG